MKESHLTLRLSDALARALERSARERGVAKSHVAREAVARYLAPTGPGPSNVLVRGADILARWSELPRLTVAEATDLAREIRGARKALPPPKPPWD